MYKCQSEECRDSSPLYTDLFVQSSWADGTPADTCRHCHQKLSLIDKEEATRQSAMIKTKGCSAASKPFAH